MGKTMITKGKHTYITQEIAMYGKIRLTIGDYCSIASGVRIESGNHPWTVDHLSVSNYPFHEQMGLDYTLCRGDYHVDIGNDVWICTKAVLLDGIKIGDGAIVATFSVVTKDVPPYAMVAGNPARIKYYRFEQPVIEKLLKIAWWNWDEEKIKEAVPYMKNVYKFIEKYE